MLMIFSFFKKMVCILFFFFLFFCCLLAQRHFASMPFCPAIPTPSHIQNLFWIVALPPEVHRMSLYQAPCVDLTLKALNRTASGKDGDRNTRWGWGHHESNARKATDAIIVAVFIFYSAVVDEEEDYMMLWKSISVWDDFLWGCRPRLLSQSHQH